jgi:hypothetical protein
MEEMMMSVQTIEAFTDADGNLQFAEAVRLPAYTKVFVVIPEQTIPYAEIVPETLGLPLATIRFPLVRVAENGLTERLVKTVVGDAHAEL